MTTFAALELLARTGFLVKGALYIVIGALAVQVAARSGGRITGTSGALAQLLQQPYGRTLLLVCGIGLFGYAIWRILQGVFDPDRLGGGWGGLAMRASFVLRGVLHAALGGQAFRLYRGASSRSANSEQQLAAEAFQWPLGDWLVVLVGIALVGFAIQQAYAAITLRLERNLDLYALRREAGEWAVSVSRLGVAARAVAFALIGWAAVVAGWSREASEVGTMTSALRTLADQPGALGRWLFGLVAAGFVAYGFYEIIHARYLHIRRVG